MDFIYCLLIVFISGIANYFFTEWVGSVAKQDVIDDSERRLFKGNKKIVEESSIDSMMEFLRPHVKQSAKFYWAPFSPEGRYIYYCPKCLMTHIYHTSSGNYCDVCWEFVETKTCKLEDYPQTLIDKV